MYDLVNHCHVIDCRYCQQTFKTRFGLKRYCSDQCHIQAHPRRLPRYPRWTHQEDRTLRQLAGEMPVKEIAARLGRTYDAVKTRARYLKINLVRYGERNPWAKHSDAVVERARTLYDEGLKARAIASRLGIPLGTVEKYIYYRDRLGPPIERYF